MTVEKAVLNEKSQAVDAKLTALTKARYDRIAPMYDFMQLGMDLIMAPGRKGLYDRIKGPRVLEIGVGTGNGFSHYGPGLRITGLDLSERMVKRAEKKAAKLGLDIRLLQADAQALPFEDASFDTVIATCVFCSVPDPVKGLREIRRVLVPGGQLLLLEHVLSHKKFLRRMMNMMNPMTVRMMGANINRETVGNIKAAEFEDVRDENLFLDVVKRIEAKTKSSID